MAIAQSTTGTSVGPAAFAVGHLIQGWDRKPAPGSCMAARSMWQFLQSLGINYCTRVHMGVHTHTHKMCEEEANCPQISQVHFVSFEITGLISSLPCNSVQHQDCVCTEYLIIIITSLGGCLHLCPKKGTNKMPAGGSPLPGTCSGSGTPGWRRVGVCLHNLSRRRKEGLV